MNKPITNADVIASVHARITALDNERIRLVKALNILAITELVAQDAKVRAKAKEAKPSPKKKRRKLPPWSPSANASVYVQTLYDALEDGSDLTTAQLTQRVHNAGFTDVIETQVSGSLSWMKQSGRLTQNKGHWRRKHARHQNGKATPAPIEVVKPLRTEEMGSLAHAVANANQ